MLKGLLSNVVNSASVVQIVHSSSRLHIAASSRVAGSGGSTKMQGEAGASTVPSKLQHPRNARLCACRLLAIEVVGDGTYSRTYSMFTSSYIQREVVETLTKTCQDDMRMWCMVPGTPQAGEHFAVALLLKTQ